MTRIERITRDAKQHLGWDNHDARNLRFIAKRIEAHRLAAMLAEIEALLLGTPIDEEIADWMSFRAVVEQDRIERINELLSPRPRFCLATALTCCLGIVSLAGMHLATLVIQ